MPTALRCVCLLWMLSLASCVAAQPTPVTPPAARPGIDTLAATDFAILRNKRVGLVAHPASVDAQLRHTVDLLNDAPQVNLVALFGPEHGVRGDVHAGDWVPSTRDAKTGIVVHSLYGKTRKPTAEMLAGIDVLVIDLQDIGVRSYTFISTMKLCLEACAEHDVELVVLDRPNPLGGRRVEGPPLDPRFMSFVGAFEIPYVHGMTMGELAWMARDGFAPGFGKLTVIKMSGWTRDMTWRDTRLEWVPTSPHIPTPESVAGYAALGLVGELGQISNGVGYTRPFEMLGAPDLDAEQLAARLERGNWQGVTFRPAHYRPFYGLFKGETVHGVQVHIDLKRADALVEIGFVAMQALDAKRRLSVAAPERVTMFDKTTGSDVPRRTLQAGESLDRLFASWRADARAFRTARAPYLLYD